MSLLTVGKLVDLYFLFEQIAIVKKKKNAAAVHQIAMPGFTKLLALPL